MSFERLSERLRALQESNAQLKELIDRLATIKFQPGSVPVDDDEDNVKTELTVEIHQTIKDQEEDLDVLKDDVADLEPGVHSSEQEQLKAGLQRNVNRAFQELKGLAKAFQAAHRAANQKLQEAKREERELIVKSYQQSFISGSSGASSPVPWQARKSPAPSILSREDKSVNASSDVTLALRRVHTTMQEELSKSQFAQDMLRESTAALAKLDETYLTLSTLLNNSKTLLGTLLRSQKSDTWYLETAFYILSATIAWLVFRRLIYGPAWWLVWFPLKMFVGAWLRVLAAVGVFGGSSVDIGLSSAVGGQTVVHHNPARATVVGSDAPVINVANDRSSSIRETDAPQDETLTEQVGRIIDESQANEGAEEGGTVGNMESAEGEPVEAEKNPKKRMWDEPKEAAKEAQRKKDEL